jgi:hypothetical protein
MTETGRGKAYTQFLMRDLQRVILQVIKNRVEISN